MTSRLVSTVIAAAALAAAAPSFAQGSGADPDRVGTPKVWIPPQEAPAQPAAPRGERREQGQRDGQRDANRQPRQPQQQQAQPQAESRHDGRRGEQDRRYSDNRQGGDHRGNDRRGYGYVVPRANYYYVPAPVYYGAPSVYYGGVPSNNYYGYNNAPVMLQPGDYLPAELRQQQFVVLDWEWRGLTPPPYGYHWMLLGPDNYALVLDSTGQIVSLVASR